MIDLDNWADFDRMAVMVNSGSTMRTAPSRFSVGILPPEFTSRGWRFLHGGPIMANRPTFQFYASDWLGSTKRAMMTPAQRGAYIDLLCYQWGDESCSLPDNDKTLAALSGLGDDWVNGGSSALRPCFPKHPTLPGRVANPKLLQVRKDRDEWVEHSREGGKKSGETRRKQAKDKTKGGSRAVEGHLNTPSPSPSPSSSPSPTPKKSTSLVAVDAFSKFWAAVPNKTGKGAARKAYTAAVKRICQQTGRKPLGVRAWLTARMTAFAATPKAKGQYCPHPATWLNQDRYDDDPAEWQKGDTSEPVDVVAETQKRWREKADDKG